MATPELLTTSIDVEFRTRVNGTIIQIVSQSASDRFIRIAVTDGGNAEIELPEVGGVVRSYSYGIDLNDGEWHSLSLSFSPRGVVSATIDGSGSADLTLDSDVPSLGVFVEGGYVIVGAEAAATQPGSSPRDIYTTDGGSEGEEVEVVTQTDIYAMSDFFRGCLGELRMGGVLLPFYTEEQLVNSTASLKFVVRRSEGDVNASSDCVLCYQEECQNGGVCEDPSSVFECRCPEGFEDAVCGTNIDECVNSRCINDGVCVDGIASYRCECLIGWTGEFCEEDLDECLAQPCLNGGHCSESLSIGNYTCDCPSDFVGRNCEEVKIKTCAHTPCLNGGTCRDGQNPYTDDLYFCDCLTGYKGTDCEIKKDFCEEFLQPCKNGASCISDDQTYVRS